MYPRSRSHHREPVGQRRLEPNLDGRISRRALCGVAVLLAVIVGAATYYWPTAIEGPTEPFSLKQLQTVSPLLASGFRAGEGKTVFVCKLADG